MQILSAEIKDGGLYSDFIVDGAEVAAAGSPQAAVGKAATIIANANGLKSLLYSRVTQAEDQPDGGVKVKFEAAIPPKVTLGQYKGLEVDVEDADDFDSAVLIAASDNMKVDVPKIVIERQLETMLLEVQTELLQSISCNTLADTYYIILDLNETLGIEEEEEKTWATAKYVAETYVNKGTQDMELLIDTICDGTDLDSGSVEAAVQRRARLRNEQAPEITAQQVFDAYLRTMDMSEMEWKGSRKGAALLQSRIDFLLDAVVEEEGLTANNTELDEAASKLAQMYQMSDKDVLAIVGDEAIRQQIKLSKARQLIVESARVMSAGE